MATKWNLRCVEHKLVMDCAVLRGRRSYEMHGGEGRTLNGNDSSILNAGYVDALWGFVGSNRGRRNLGLSSGTAVTVVNHFVPVQYRLHSGFGFTARRQAVLLVERNGRLPQKTAVASWPRARVGFLPSVLA